HIVHKAAIIFSLFSMLFLLCWLFEPVQHIHVIPVFVYWGYRAVLISFSLTSFQKFLQLFIRHAAAFVSVGLRFLLFQQAIPFLTLYNCCHDYFCLIVSLLKPSITASHVHFSLPSSHTRSTPQPPDMRYRPNRFPADDIPAYPPPQTP